MIGYIFGAFFKQFTLSFTDIVNKNKGVAEKSPLINENNKVASKPQIFILLSIVPANFCCKDMSMHNRKDIGFEGGDKLLSLANSSPFIPFLRDSFVVN